MDVYGLLGNPVGHSLSPPMHEAAYEARGMDATYVTFEPDRDALGDAIRGASSLGIAGLNVTIPFKEGAIDHVEPDDLAARIGAVNTIAFPEGGSAGADDRDAVTRPTGHNTDAAGAVRALRERGFADRDDSLDGATAVVVGAGGAGRAIAFGLAEAGATVRVANRTVERATALASEVPDASGHGLDDLPTLLADATVLVNATSVGMESDESIVPSEALHEDLVVMDAVYRPRETRLLRDAAATGATAVDGTWMLLYQGAAAFERWTGRDAPVAAMGRVLRSSFEANTDQER
ncbi:shikimate 5-dehydrogenase [Halovivax ruber XH-70]|uniref:Shikimate dehydrogenase (NADP(+)) n=1 Tax=Halovivax ruber (strain DSM 18193 / JCM 13892 / XH-70) TaxID=797302 RepID=L0IGD5_HALRX|nr:shikimate dehydrogenase [Halovivax ruber]AGB17052.1 shikimate 5-dehydrogenase [Halovivax ruber XH-70]